jgi:hypothetical protein
MTSAWALTHLALIVTLVACGRTPASKGDTGLAASPDSSRAKASPAPPDTRVAAPVPPSSGSPATPGTVTPTPTPSETVMTGTIAVGGLANDPVTSLRVEGGSPVTLVGPLEPELRTLGAATVWVTGAPGPGRPNATFAVTRYEIVSIGGAKPLVGHVTVRGGDTFLAMERDTVRLVAAPAELTGKQGAKAWVVGRRNGNDLTPQTYGIIRHP